MIQQYRADTVTRMPSVFTRIIDGELPGRFVHRDDLCVAFLTIAPLTTGHVLVVPVDEVDHWVDLDSELAAHLMTVAQRIGRALRVSYGRARVGLVIAGLEVPHTHLHVFGFDELAQMDFTRANPNPAPGTLDDAQARLLAALAGDEQAPTSG